MVGTDYDPMLAKVIAHADDRPAALRRLARALGELELLGVTTNAAFSRALLEREDVRAGEIDTGLLERILAEPPPAPPEDLVPAAALAAAGTARPAGPFRLRLEEHGELRVADGAVRAGEREWRADVRAGAGGRVRVALDGLARTYAFARDGDALWIARDGHRLGCASRAPPRAAPPTARTRWRRRCPARCCSSTRRTARRSRRGRCSS